MGETLTTDTSGIADADGLTNVSYSYRWARNDGSTDTDITGAADSSYTLVDADEGQTIKVKATFADDAGDEETLTSAATATVAARPNTPMTYAQDDTTAPTISSVNITSDPDADIRTHGPYEMAGTNGTGYHFQRGWYRIGDHITATVTFTETITVTGAPELRINVGRSSKIASFETANGTTAAFTYTVIDGDSDSDGISISPNRLTLSGGTIKDDANNDAVLSYSAVSTLATHKVDGIRPRLRDFSVLSLWRQGSRDDVFDIGDEIFAHAQFSEPVFGSIAGPPTINLQIGDEFRPAEWEVTAIPQYPTLFNYFIEEGDWDSDGVSILADSVNLNGGYIKDTAGNDAILTHPPATSEWRVDGIRAFVTSIAITSNPGTDNTYGEGDNIEITVTFSELVYATEYNQIEVDIGGTARKANGPLPTLTSSRDVVFTYTVQSRDNDTDGISIRANAITSPATDFGIKDALSDWPGGNMAYLEHASLTADAAHKVGTTGDETNPKPDPPIPTPHEPRAHRQTCHRRHSSREADPNRARVGHSRPKRPNQYHIHLPVDPRTKQRGHEHFERHRSYLHTYQERRRQHDQSPSEFYR